MTFKLTTQQIARTFNCVAKHYDESAFVQQEIGKRLLAKLAVMRLDPSVIVDCAAGTGFCSALLKKRFPLASVVALDCAQEMLKICQHKNRADFCICADATQLPLAPNSVDLVVANLILPWCVDINRIFPALQQILKPNGLFLFTTLGPDTLLELRQSWAEVNATPHVMPFIDMHNWGDALLRAQLLDPVVEMEKLTLSYPSVEQLVTDLRSCGVVNRHPQRAKGLTSPRQWRRFLDSYEQYQNADGNIPVTVEVIYGHGWGRRTEDGGVVSLMRH